MSGKTKFSRLIGFMSVIFNPVVMLLYVNLWFFGFSGLVVSTDASITSWYFDYKVLLMLISLFIVLFYLRVVDEIKDYDYDKKFNPDRPLVSGVVQIKDLNVFVIFSVLLVVLINVFISTVLLVIIMFAMTYGAFLLWIEKKSELIKNNIMLNLLVTYPVTLILNIYILAFVVIHYNANIDLAKVMTLVTVLSIFMQFEFGRKTCWEKHSDSSMKLYSNSIGAKGSLYVILFFAFYAVCSSLFVATPWMKKGFEAVAGWMLLLPIILTFISVKKFLAIESIDPVPKLKAVMGPFNQLFMILAYVTLILYTIASKDVIFLLVR